MIRKLYLFIAAPLLFQTIAAHISKTVPVFILDMDRSLSGVASSKSPFSTLDKTKFSEIIVDALNKADRIIVFVEDLLSPEDLSSRDKLGSPYYLLRQGLIDDTVKHFPSVDAPFSVLKDLIPMTDFNTFRLDDRTSKLPLYDSNMRHIYVFFNERANTSRVDVLRQHDLIMREVHYAVKQRAGGPVVAFYTGKVNPNAVGKNAPEDSPWESETRRNAIWCRNSKIILAVEGIRIYHKNKAIALPPTDTGEVACTYHWDHESEPAEVTVDLPLAAYTLRCKFTYSDVTWTLVSCQLRPEEASALRSGEGAYLDIRRSFRYADTYHHTRPFDFRSEEGNGVVVNKITVEVTNKEDQKKFSIVIEPIIEDKSKGGKGGPGGGQGGSGGGQGGSGGGQGGPGGKGGAKNETGQGAKNKTDQDPKKATDQEPKNDTDQQPKDETGQKPKDETGQKPKDETGQKPKDETGQEDKDVEDESVIGGGKKTPPLLSKEKEKDDKDFFFTEPLLTCFFISSILLAILIYGFVNLASVQANSKYDDPRSKPLMFTEM